MKNLSRLVFVTLLVMATGNVNAQDKNNPWQITVGVNAVDALGTGNQVGNEDIGFSRLYDVGGEWSVSPATSMLSVGRYLGNNFSVGVAGTFNRLDKWNTGVQKATATSELMYYGLDGMVKYSLADLVNSNKLEPFVSLGGGYTWMEQPGTELAGLATLNGTVGVTYWFNDFIGITAQSGLKNSFDEVVLVDHFQHSVGVTIKFGGKDTDSDGVYDKYDVCPEVPGLAEFNGCPDSDSDGIQDSEDTCPNEAGLAEYNGCPDSDGDGISDNNDTCPNEAGLKALSGCPDADADGVANAQDTCPNEAGPVANNGCPWKDGDSDGVLDKDDNCPTEAGTVANNGCKDVVQSQAAIDALAKTIYFDYKSSILKSESYLVLDKVIALLKDYKGYNIIVDGHTDNIGSKSYNQTLSEARATAVSDYLTSKGIDSNALTSNGYGEENPAVSNKTEEGRTQNRRSEITISIK